MEYFITGIDTDIGKTFITKSLALKLEKDGKKVGVFKPLQSSAIETQNGLLAPDLEAIKELSTSINTKCSYIFKGDVSPALAARLTGITIDIEKIKKDFNSFKKENEITLVEGAGGILAPATDSMLCADLIKELNIPIKGIIINKIPTKTNDLATQNFIDELKRYTDVEIIGEIKEINNSNILEEFKRIQL